jgi:hypothetical protein
MPDTLVNVLISEPEGGYARANTFVSVRDTSVLNRVLSRMVLGMLQLKQSYKSGLEV